MSLFFTASPTVQNTHNRFWQGFFTSLARQGLEAVATIKPKPRHACVDMGNGNSLT